MANTTGKKHGGRKKGTPNKRNEELLERARAMGADPAEYLMLYVKGDMRKLGYEDREKVRKRDHELKQQEYEQKTAGIKDKKKIAAFPKLRELTADERHEINLFPAKERRDAAEMLMPYLYGKRKQIEHKAAEGAGELLRKLIGGDPSDGESGEDD